MNKISAHQIFLLASATIIFGLLCSRFLISIGMILFLVAALWEGNVREKWNAFIQNKFYLAITGIFIIFFISGIWSEDLSYFWNRMRIKLPILFLPFAFSAIPRLDIKMLKQIFGMYVIGILISVFWSIGMFVFDAEHFISIYSKGQIIPTPIHHIRFSLMIAVAAAAAIYILLESSIFKVRKAEKICLILTIVLLILYLHFLAVRSGVLSLYVLLACLAVTFIQKKSNRKYLIPLLTGMVLLAFLSIKFVPTVKNKIDYMKYSLLLFSKNENIRELSDSRRLGSIYAGVELTRQNPVLGVGIGDIMTETNRYLEKHYPELTDLELLPHNQYLLTSAALGIIGLIAFILFTCIPLLYLQGYKDFFFLGTQMMLFASFLVEHTIESQIGVALYIFVLLLAMKSRETIISRS